MSKCRECHKNLEAGFCIDCHSCTFQSYIKVEIQLAATRARLAVYQKALEIAFHNWGSWMECMLPEVAISAVITQARAEIEKSADEKTKKWCEKQLKELKAVEEATANYENSQLCEDDFAPGDAWGDQ